MHLQFLKSPRMAGVSWTVKVKEKWTSFKRYSFLSKIYWSLLLGGLGFLLYHDYGIYQRKRETSTAAQETQAMAKLLPRAVLIGFPRCGVASIPDHMNIHSDVAWSKNLNFFHNDVKYKRGLESLLDEIPSSALGAIGIDHHMEYVLHEKAASHIQHMNSSAQILIGVCDPVKRAITAYKDYIIAQMAKNESYETFEDLVLKNGNGKVNADHRFISDGLYIQHINMWLKYFPLKQMLFIHNKEFKEEPFTVLKKVEDFLGLDNQITAIALDDYLTLKAENSVPVVKPKPHPDISDEVRDKLYVFYEKHNKALFKAINQTYTWE